MTSAKAAHSRTCTVLADTLEATLLVIKKLEDYLMPYGAEY